MLDTLTVPTAPEITVRPSTEADVPAMLAIYTHHVEHGLGEVEIEPLHPDDLKRRRKNMLRRRLPHLVADRGGVVVGYAYAVPFRKRPAYRYVVKNSIYVHHEHLHAGVGRRLLAGLIDACGAHGFRQMIAYIESGNEPSLALHETFGFVRVAVLKSVGFKFGHWTDSVMLQRPLGDGDASVPGPGDGARDVVE